MSDSSGDFLKDARWLMDEQRYAVARLSPAAVTAAAAIIAEQERPFHALIVDRDEVTLVAPVELFEVAARRFAGLEIGPVVYRLITLDVVFTLEVVGVLARLTPVLAHAGIPILALSSFSRDHFLIPEDRADDALRVLRALSPS
jgi:hypothetical protein